MLEDRLVPSSFFYAVTGLTDAAGSITGGSGTQANPYQATTLRAAITAATADGGIDTINLASNAIYQLSTVDNYWYGPDALPAISSSITIDGNGSTLECTGSTPMRLFYVSGGLSGLSAGNLTLENLTLAGGLAEGGAGARGGGGLGAGGAIFNQGTVNLVDSTLSGNTAQGGTSNRGYNGSGDGMGSGGTNAQGGGFGGPAPGAVGGAAARRARAATAVAAALPAPGIAQLRTTAPRVAGSAAWAERAVVLRETPAGAAATAAAAGRTTVV